MPTLEELFNNQFDVHRPIIEQDRLACAGIQKGLRSSLAARGRLAWEEPIAHFNRWLIERYREALPWECEGRVFGAGSAKPHRVDLAMREVRGEPGALSRIGRRCVSRLLDRDSEDATRSRGLPTA